MDPVWWALLGGAAWKALLDRFFLMGPGWWARLVDPLWWASLGPCLVDPAWRISLGGPSLRGPRVGASRLTSLNQTKKLRGSGWL